MFLFWYKNIKKYLFWIKYKSIILRIRNESVKLHKSSMWFEANCKFHRMVLSFIHMVNVVYGFEAICKFHTCSFSFGWSMWFSFVSISIPKLYVVWKSQLTLRKMIILAIALFSKFLYYIYFHMGYFQQPPL